MPINRKTIELTLSGNSLIATDKSTGLSTTDAGIEGESSAVWLYVEIPEEWQDLSCRLQVIAQNGIYDESDQPDNNIINMPLRQGITVPGRLIVSLIGSTDTGIRRTAECRSLVISPSSIVTDAVSEFYPLDFEKLKEVVDTEVVHTITGSGGALVTKTDDTTYNINVTGTGGDMLQANYANGNGESNSNVVDHAIYSDSVKRSYACFPVGFSTVYHGSKAPDHTLFEQGQLISRTTYADLWSFAQSSGNIVSDSEWSSSKQGSFSTGDGSTTFRLPDMRGIVPIGSGTAKSGTTYMLGNAGGEETHKLTTAEMPSHAHGFDVSGYTTVGLGYITNQAASGSGVTTCDFNRTTSSTASTGSEGSHNNLQPYAVVNYIIVY